MGMNGVVIVGLATGRSRGGRGDAGKVRAAPGIRAAPPRVSPPSPAPKVQPPPPPAAHPMAHPVMQAALAPLPDLPQARFEPVPAPMRWPGWLEHELRAVPGGIGQQHTTACNHLALRAGPGADARIERAAVEVRIAFLIADLLHQTFD